MENLSINKNNFESNVKSHLEQIRSRKDQQRVKDRIDCIASKMMDETKSYEKMNLKSINESFFFSSFVH
jgi:hypothetical protein